MYKPTECNGTSTGELRVPNRATCWGHTILRKDQLPNGLEYCNYEITDERDLYQFQEGFSKYHPEIILMNIQFLLIVG